jgi:hypothetical protein
MSVSELQTVVVLLLIANIVLWPIAAYWCGRLHEQKRRGKR